MRSMAALSRRILNLPAFLVPILVFVLLSAVRASGQSVASPQSPPNSSKRPVPVDQEQFLPYWTTETGWATELQLRNNLAGKSLVVTPYLRTSEGAEVALAAVTLLPREVQSIDLDAAIPAGESQLVGTYGSVVLRYHSNSLRNLYAASMLRTVGHPIAFHVDATGEIQNYEVANREGIWWLPNDSASDYLILNNQGANAIQLDLSLFDSVGRAYVQKLSLEPRETARLSVRKLVQQGGLTGSYGGIKISTNAHAGSLDSLHFLFDQKVGFSALLKMFDHDPNATIEQRDNAKTATWTLRAPMLALTNPDPVMAFPEGTTLQPQLFVRNTTGKPQSASLRFNWKGDSSTGKSQGPSLQLRPYKTRRVDVGALQDGAILPKDAHWTSVTITTNSLPDEVMAIAASYDATLQHGAQTPFSDQLSFAWEGGMWEYNAHHNSLMTVGNGSTKPTRAALTLFYNQGTERYDLEQTLQPDEQMWIDVGKLIRERVPDKNRKVLPDDLSSGSYEFRDLNDHLVGSLFEGKLIYEKTYGHVVYGCMECCPYLAPAVDADPLGIPLLGTAPNGVQAEDCNGTNQDVSRNFNGNWSTANSNIATVDMYGTHTGVAVGTTTSATFGLLSTQSGRICPNQRKNTGGTDHVTPNIASISPPDGLVGNTVSVSLSGKGFGSSPSLIAPTGVTPTVQSSSDTQITATLAISTSVSGGNQSIQVKNTQSGQTSNGVNFFVQIPKTLVRSPDYGSNGLGPVNTITNGSVINIYGVTELTNQCGVYENIGYQLVDQRTPAQNIYGNYDLHEQFSNYSGAKTIPANQDNPITLSQTVLGDTQ